MAILGALLIGALVVAYEAPPLYRQERYADLIVFSVLTVVGLTLGILLLLDVPLSSPAKYIESATNFLMKTFKTTASYFAG